MTTCHTPTKSRYATRQAADRAARHAALTIGRHLRPYECRCGWWHLTKRSANPTARAINGPTP